MILRAASSPNLLEDPSILDSVIATDGWQTLMTFTREMARTYRAQNYVHSCLTLVLQPHDRQRLHLRHRCPRRRTWMKTFLPSSTNNLREKMLTLEAPQQVAHRAVGILGYVLTARLKTRTVGQIVRFVDCRCRG